MLAPVQGELPAPSERALRHAIWAGLAYPFAKLLLFIAVYGLHAEDVELFFAELILFGGLSWCIRLRSPVCLLLAAAVLVLDQIICLILQEHPLHLPLGLLLLYCYIDAFQGLRKFARQQAV
ncbi:hypothetical protein V8J88_23670 [Massilia sp. W12]|uniref:hypothetical protein n=1 Tax=Massilia sp. W12 TaxID=3126507 RepID=UPI0030CB3EE5